MDKPRILLALIALTALAAALQLDPHPTAAGNALSITSVAVEPPEPAERDLIRITVEGTMSSTCPVSSSHELFENFILALNVFIPPGSICLQIPGSFSVTEEIDRLPAGAYQVVIYCWVSPCGSTTFAVTGSSVGGIAEFPDVVATTPLQTSDSNAGLLGGIAAIAIAGLALASAAWYARRRWWA